METTELPRRREILSAIAGSGVLIGTSGLATAKGKPTITARSPDCESIELSYTERGPTAETIIDGPETKKCSIEPGATKMLSVEAGEYVIDAHPENSSRNSSGIDVAGSPVTVEGCGEVYSLSARADCAYKQDDRFDLVFTNGLNRCMIYEWRGYKDGELVESHQARFYQQNSSYFLDYRTSDFDRLEFDAWSGGEYYSDEECMVKKKRAAINGDVTPIEFVGPWDTCRELKNQTTL